MPKINTGWLKENVACYIRSCQSKNLVRQNKRSYRTVVGPYGDIVPEYKVHCRVFKCQACGAITFTTDDGESLMRSGEQPLFPLSAFDFGIYVDEDSFGFLTFFLQFTGDDSLPYLPYDDLRDLHIIAFQDYFKKRGIKVANEMENAWSAHPDDGTTYFDRLSEERLPEQQEVDNLKQALLEAGAKLNKELNAEYFGLV